jgi:hypothetical protein
MNNNNDCVSKMCTLEYERSGGGGDTYEAYPRRLVQLLRGLGGEVGE